MKDATNMTIRPHIRLVLTLFLALTISTCHAVVYVDDTAPGLPHDGNSWKTAHTTIQAGILDADTTNEEVWVAAGTYTGPINTEEGVDLYGGFVGMEWDRVQRDWIANETIITGGLQAYETATIDGFTITGALQNDVGGLRVKISKCRITGNQTGILAVASPSFTVENCIISDNTDGIVVAQGAMGYLNYNTIVESTNWGVACKGTNPRLQGNILAYNGCGIRAAFGGTPVLSYNCVYGNTLDYSSVTPGLHDISADPLFKNKDAGDYHLTAASPCIDTNDGQMNPSIDYEGSSRGQPMGSDMGAYEYPADLMDIKRTIPDGGHVNLGALSVTAVYPEASAFGRIYVEREDRSAATRVDLKNIMLIPGDRVNISGSIYTDGVSGERCIGNASAMITRGRSIPRPLGMPLRSAVGGTLGLQVGVADAVGMNNLGLSARIFGRVSHADTSFYYVDDGSKVSDSSGHSGVKVLALGTPIPAQNEYVNLKGIVSCFKEGEDIRRLIRAGGEPVVQPDFQAMAGNGPEISTLADDGGILLAWNMNAYPSGVVQYHIWRDGVTSAVIGVDPTGAPGRTMPVGSFHHVVVDDTIPRTFTYNYATWNEGLGSSSGSAQGIVPGSTHHYWWSALFQGYGPGGYVYLESLPVYMGSATYLTRPITVSPGATSAFEPVDLSDVTFNWKGSKGANQYRIEVSPSASFAREMTWCADVDESTSVDGATVSRRFEDVLDQASELSSLPPGTTLYWRIGARNSGDNPGPYPSGSDSTPLVSGAKHTRFLYSDRYSILTFIIGG